MSTEAANTARGASRYLFDGVFSIEAPEKKQPPAPKFDQAALDAVAAAAREEGRREGLAEARREAEADVSKRIAASAAALVQAAKKLTVQRAAEEQQATEEAVRIALTAARKLAATLIDREPTAELEGLLRQCIGWAADAPHLVVRVHDEAVDPLRERIEALAAAQGFQGRLMVLPDPEVAPGDGRIDWADGGAVRELAKIDEAISEAVERYLATRRPEA